MTSEKWGRQYAHKTDAFSDTGYWRRDANMALHSLSLVPGDVLVDLACGTGRLLAMAGQMFESVDLVGVDPNRHGHELCARRAPDAVILGSLSEQEDESVNACTIIHAVSQFEDPSRVLTELWEKMVPGGQVVVVTHNKLWGAACAPFDLLSGYRSDPTITRNFRLGELAQLMRDNGYKVEKAVRFGIGILPALGLPLQPRLMVSCRRPS